MNYTTYASKLIKYFEQENRDYSGAENPLRIAREWKLLLNQSSSDQRNQLLRKSKFLDNSSAEYELKLMIKLWVEELGEL